MALRYNLGAISMYVEFTTEIGWYDLEIEYREEVQGLSNRISQGWKVGEERKDQQRITLMGKRP